MHNSFLINVRDCGAVGDGRAKDTTALQQAIDACHAAGGGHVLVPSGCYLSGTLYLKSGVELHLTGGATIKGSPDRADYNDSDIFPENQAFAAESVAAAHLIVAYRQENISITGSGTIDGNSAAFFGPLPAGAVASYRYKSGDFPIKDWRPGQMIFLCRCRNIVVRDVSLLNSPYWTLFLLGCEDVRIRGLRIDNPPATRNGDGIDVDCCRNVAISDCIIHSGDDCITARANVLPLGEQAVPCENVVVSNCVLSTPCNAIRVGVGDGAIRRCSFNNIIIPDASRAISMVCRYGEMKPGHASSGASIEHVHFSNFTCNVGFPFSIHVGPGAARPAAIRDVSFNHFNIVASAGSHIIGSDQIPVERLRFDLINWTIRGGTDNCRFVDAIPEVFSLFGYPGVASAPALPCVLYGRHIRDAVFENIRIRWDHVSAVWRDTLRMERCHDVQIDRISGPLRPVGQTS